MQFDVPQGVQCIACSSAGLCFTTARQLYLVPNSDDPDATPLEPFLLPFEPATMCAFDTTLFVACTHSYLTIDMSERFVIRDMYSPSEGNDLFALITHSIFSIDGSTVFITSGSDVVMVALGGRRLDDDAEDADGVEGNSLVVVPCGHYFSGTSPDASVVALVASSAQYVFVLSRLNHLVALELQTDEQSTDDDGDAFRMARDGHVVVAASVITAMHCDGKHGHLLLGASNGDVHILDHVTLQPLHVISLMKSFCALDMSSQTLTDGVDCPLESLRLGNVQLVVHQIVVVSSTTIGIATSCGVVALSRASLAIQSIDTFEIVAAVAVLSPVAPFVGAWMPFIQRVVWQRITREDSAMLAKADVIHASSSLPQLFLSPLQPTTSLADPNAKPVTFHKKVKSIGNLDKTLALSLSYTYAWRSSLPTARNLPHGEKHTAVLMDVLACCAKDLTGCGSRISHSRTTLSVAAVTNKCRPSGSTSANRLLRMSSRLCTGLE